MQFFKSSLWSGLSVGIKAVSSLIINKVIATCYDPSGIALLAHFQNFLGIFLSIPNDGLNMGVIKYMSDKDISLSEYRKIFNAGFILNIVYFLLAIAGVFIFKEYFISVFAGYLEQRVWIILILISILLQLMNMFFLSIILSAQHLKTYVSLNIASSATAAIVVYFFAHKGGDISLTLLASAFGPSVFFFASVYFSFKNKNMRFAFSEIFDDWSGYRKLSHFILMAVSSLIFGKVVDFVVRQYVINKYGLEQTGLWQSVVKLSDLYTAAFIAIVGMVYYPRISELINYNERFKKYVRTVMSLSLPVIFFGLLLVHFFKEEILVLLFESEFKQASYLVDYQLIGDLFKLVSYILAYIIFAQARTFIYIMSQGLSALVFIGLIYLCSSYWGLEGLPIAHAIRYILYFLFVVLLYRKTLFA